jgi:hypothetical protein
VLRGYIQDADATLISETLEEVAMGAIGRPKREIEIPVTLPAEREPEPVPAREPAPAPPVEAPVPAGH